MSDIIHETIGISAELQVQLLVSFLIILVVWILRRLTIRFLVDKIEDYKERYRWSKIVKNASIFLIAIFLSRVWFGMFESVGTFLGLLSAGLAIAFKDLLVNMGGWLFILTRKPLKVGDRIQIDSLIGDVIDIRLFQFSIIEVGNWVDADQSTGRIVHVPNGLVFSKWQANYNEGFEYIWNEIPVLLTFESNWRKGKEILLNSVELHSEQITSDVEKQIKEASKKFMIHYSKLTPIVYTSVRDCGVLLTIRYICHIKKRRGSEQLIWEEILDRFAENNDIDFAYPTVRYYNNISEGKEGARASD